MKKQDKIRILTKENKVGLLIIVGFFACLFLVLSASSLGISGAAMVMAVIAGLIGVVVQIIGAIILWLITGFVLVDYFLEFWLGKTERW